MFLMKMRMPVEKGNAAIKDPAFGKKMEEMLQALEPGGVFRLGRGPAGVAT
ncbi:MAG: hypothetical protein HYY34_01085 [Chloroflexi bacterium]|nr:hypothetical protein [Chloroflexota bacterium]